MKQQRLLRALNMVAGRRNAAGRISRNYGRDHPVGQMGRRHCAVLSQRQARPSTHGC